MSAEIGPTTSIPSARAAATAGARFSSSSVPNSPFSPQCGLIPATAIRGDAIPIRCKCRCPMRIVSSTRSGFARSIAVRSETWVETWMTFSRSEASSIHDAFCPVRCASRPVWPS